MSDSLAIFLVEPGVSFHAVREVRGDRARVSLQGPSDPKKAQRPSLTRFPSSILLPFFFLGSLIQTE